jgi:type II secretory pathway pseudopilin PulG
MKKSFSLIELVIVIIVIGILYSSINFSLKDTSLQEATQQLIYHINYTHILAMKDNKIQYYPINNSNIEMNRSKYWFKQWWQIRISQKNNGEYFYEVFSDSSSNSTTTNYDTEGTLIKEFAINPLNGKYLDPNYANNNDERLNLTKYYGIKKIKIGTSTINKLNSFRLLYDNYGNCYLSEGDKGDAGDINPYDMEKRKLLLKNVTIILCKDENCNENMNICISSKFGNAYICK